MDSIEAAILRTVIYADLFHYPLTSAEIHHFLIHDQPVSRAAIEQALLSDSDLCDSINLIDGYVVYGNRGELIALRQERERAARHLWPLAVQYGQWLARLPFVRMVAITGALAMHNPADYDDDLDYMLVTTARRVWLARAFAVALVRLGRLRGVEICPNFVLAENALIQERQDIFIAHEVTQMVPLYGNGLYQQFRTANEWVMNQLPNAQEVFHAEAEKMPSGGWRWLKMALETVLSGNIGDRIEQWEYQRKMRRFADAMQKPDSSAKLDEAQVKGHFDDHGHPILRQYRERLQKHGLLQETSDTALRVPSED